jgi:hypothetical protein
MTPKSMPGAPRLGSNTRKRKAAAGTNHRGAFSITTQHTQHSKAMHMNYASNSPGSQHCPRCQGTYFIDKHDPTEPHAGKRVCADCGRFITWLPKPWSKERAAAFELRHGSYAGWRLGALARHPHGLQHLRHLARYGYGNVHKAARIVLGLDDPEGTS